MQPRNPNDTQAKIDLRIRTIRTLWFALFVSVALYYIFAAFIFHPNEEAVPNTTVSLMLAATASLLVVISVPIKQRFLTQSVEQQRPDLVQKAYVVACALSEGAALLGLLDHFLTSNRYYYALFIIAGCGMLLNWPRRQHVQDACFKGPWF